MSRRLAAAGTVRNGTVTADFGWIAPARYVLTALHRHDPDREADLFSKPERIDGFTLCGLPLLESELWRHIEARDGDPVCPKCEAPDRTVADDVQEVLL